MFLYHFKGTPDAGVGGFCGLSSRQKHPREASRCEEPLQSSFSSQLANQAYEEEEAERCIFLAESEVSELAGGS